MGFEIVIKGHVKHNYFENWTLTEEKDQTTILRGACQDQACLYGVLRRIQDLGMELVSVNSLPESHEKNGE